MSDWFSEIEIRDAEFWEGFRQAASEGAAVCASQVYYDREQMARVIRELVKYSGAMRELADRHCDSLMVVMLGDILSPDAKELLK